ncbi:MAG: VanZ family protein [Streptococcaceae bacterium]|nr:VanZ family protein [Streptococcaceae bacterium]
MTTYLHSIQIGVLLFFVFLLLALIPYLIVQYRKYGHVNTWRFFVNFSFILYLICAYAMTIFPLPNVAEVAKMTGPKQNLVPFEFVRQFILYSPFRLDEPATWLPAIKSFTFIQPFFNLLLTIPFGIYLRYLFKRTFKQTVILGFLLTLSFELLQRSALFGLYPRPYRLFDVDDLMTNLLGSLLGFALAILLQKVLPDLDAVANEQAKVSLLRRFVAFIVDGFVVLIVGILLPYSYLSEVIVFLLIPIVFKASLGQLLLKIGIKSKNRWRILLRQLLMSVNFSLVYLEMYFLQRSGEVPEQDLAQNYLMAMIVLALIALPILDVIFAGLLRTKKLWYERLSGTEMAVKTKSGSF